MSTLYLDIFSGISGDMFLGAMIDLGVDLHRLEHELEKLGLDGYHLHAPRQQRSGIAGIKFDIHLAHAHPHAHHGHDDHEHHHHEHDSHGRDHDDGHEHQHDSRDFAEIKNLISRSAVSDWVKEKSLAVFRRIAVAEGKIHGRPPDEVHFHEVGAVDSIVDIVGACIALEILGKPRVLSSPVVEGTGWVNCVHGRFPVPAPATLEILGARGVPISQCDEPHELVTPTGAALLAEFVENFGSMHGLVPAKIGYGLGTRENKTRPNVLRAVLGEVHEIFESASSPTPHHDWETDTIAVLETNLDDCTAEVLGYVAERALAEGALDVFHVPAQMKKNRPGILLSILCITQDADRFSELVLRETSAFGVRRSIVERRKLRRESVVAKTPYGNVTVKLGTLNGKVIHAAPEYESCRKLAQEHGVPLAEVYEATRQGLPKI